MSFGSSILKWLHDVVASFHSRLAALEAHHGISTPAPDVHPDVAAAAQPTPSTVTIPGTDRKIDAVGAGYLGVSEETSKILDDRAKNAPAAGGLPPGPVLDAFGVPKVGQYDPGYVWQLAAVADKMHFDISSYPGQVAALATVTIKDAAGNVVIGPVEANPNQWSSPSFAGTPGMTAEVVMDKPGPGIATTYKDD